MATQLALTFGHLHLRVASAASAQLAAKISVTLPDGSSLPTKPRLIDEQCAICSLIQMAGTAAPAAAASLPMQVLVTPATLSIGVERAPSTSPPLVFHARGPPIA